jgi:UDP-N-acetyl-D-mannosaminuronate dehydrogenase
MGESEMANPERTVAVLGLGYVGLPLVGICVEAGYHVVGFDTDRSKVESLRRSESYVDDVHDQQIDEWLRKGFTPSCDPRDLQLANIFVVCVPTPLAKAGGARLDCGRNGYACGRRDAWPPM